MPNTKEAHFKHPDKTCKCLTPERRGFIDGAMSHSSDFGDGAFFAYMDEQGIDVSELEVLSNEHKAECKNV